MYLTRSSSTHFNSIGIFERLKGYAKELKLASAEVWGHSVLCVGVLSNCSKVRKSKRSERELREGYAVESKFEGSEVYEKLQDHPGHITTTSANTRFCRNLVT